MLALLGAACLPAGPLPAQTPAAAAAQISPEPTPFSAAGVVERARALAAQPYVPPGEAPAALKAIDYDGYRDIRFVPDRARWKPEGLPFHLQFFFPGWLYSQPVHVAEVRDGQAQEIAFDAALFDPGRNREAVAALPADLGFAGFRVHHPLNNEEYFDELIVFQGASYFRALAAGHVYGLSARGLALNTAEPGGEEFPVFRDFWIERPARRARELVIHALLDSPSATGAYRFVVRPGAITTTEVHATVFLRAGHTVRTLGVAPLTSMFWYGENSPHRFGDFRPEVHDSDGLQVALANGEWLWRPLANPAGVRVSSFLAENPRGFGLFQRDRDFEHYQDLEADYQRRPSAWVEPVGDWGRGSVRLVEIPTPDETHDNIVAFWVPEQLPPAGEPLSLAYRLHWFTDTHRQAPVAAAARVVATRRADFLLNHPTWRLLAVEFAGGELPREAAGGIEAVVTLGAGATLRHQTVQFNPHNQTWRATVLFEPAGEPAPLELRLYLRRGDDALSETWTYLWQP